MVRVIINICSESGELLERMAVDNDTNTSKKLGTRGASDRQLAAALQHYLEQRFDTTRDV